MGMMLLHLYLFIIEVAVECDVHVQALIIGIILALLFVCIVNPAGIIHEFTLAVDGSLLVQQSVVAACN